MKELCEPVYEWVKNMKQPTIRKSWFMLPNLFSFCEFPNRADNESLISISYFRFSRRSNTAMATIDTREPPIVRYSIPESGLRPCITPSEIKPSPVADEWPRLSFAQ